MTIFIESKKMTDKGATEIVSRPDDLVRKIVRAWWQSNTDHCFESKKLFRKAVRRNRKTLESFESIETLFTSSNYLFSTRAKDRKETLYFEDRNTKQTGRLRQQHRKGPLARIDKKPKTHRFVSKKRYKCLKQWHEKDSKQPPKFFNYEKRPTVGKHHIEFAYGRKVSGWHRSEGTVEMNTQDLDRRIESTLENIVGICSNTVKK
jgi:hypothetical protein